MIMIKPDRFRVSSQQSLNPYSARLFVPMLNAPPCIHNLVRTHSCIADEYQLVIGSVLMRNFRCGNALRLATPIVFPQTLIDKIVKVKILEVFKLGPTG